MFGVDMRQLRDVTLQPSCRPEWMRNAAERAEENFRKASEASGDMPTVSIKNEAPLRNGAVRDFRSPSTISIPSHFWV